ncbi:hypothetical protein [Streptomyces sp. NPDC093269]|uniref:hypothetical protein n=1 Tax=Streptomyces sp. NPDC093269 TaxID=3366038 RepID=UPI0037F8E0C7
MTETTEPQTPIEDTVRLEGALHLLRYALDRFTKANYRPAPEYLRELLDHATNDPGEPCDRDEQYTRAEQAEAAIARVRAITPYQQPIHGDRSKGVQIGWDAALKAVHDALQQPQEDPR